MAGLKTKEEYNGLGQAVSLAIALLKKCKANSWAQLQGAMEASDPVTVKAMKAVDLTSEQLSLIAEHQAEISLVRIAPPVIPAICAECSRYILVSDTTPTKCVVTAGCTGKPAKVAVATASKDVVPAAAPVAPAPAVAEPVLDDESPAVQDEPVEEIVDATPVEPEPAEEPTSVHPEPEPVPKPAAPAPVVEKIVFAPDDEPF